MPANPKCKNLDCDGPVGAGPDSIVTGLCEPCYNLAEDGDLRGCEGCGYYWPEKEFHYEGDIYVCEGCLETLAEERERNRSRHAHT